MGAKLYTSPRLPRNRAASTPAAWSSTYIHILRAGVLNKGNGRPSVKHETALGIAFSGNWRGPIVFAPRVITTSSSCFLLSQYTRINISAAAFVTAYGFLGAN